MNQVVGVLGEPCPQESSTQCPGKGEAAEVIIVCSMKWQLKFHTQRGGKPWVIYSLTFHGIFSSQKESTSRIILQAQ